MSDNRSFVVAFKDENMQAFETLPTQPVNFAPMALQALSVAGFGPNNLFRVDDATAVANTSPLNSAQYNAIMAVANGTAPYVSSTSAGGASLPVVSSAPISPASGSIWFNSASNTLQYYNGSTTQTLGTSSASGTITAITAGSGLSGGTITSSGTISLGTLGTAGTYYKVVTDATGRVSSGSTSLVEADIPNLVTAGHVSGSALTSGTIAGTTAINSSGAITTTGTVTAANLTATTLSGQALRLFNSASTFKITMTAPSLTADYNLVFPLTAGSNGYVLTTDGSGNLSWTAAGGAPSGAAGGDLSGTYPNPSVAKLSGTPLSIASLTTGNYLRYNGTNWVNSAILTSDIPSLATGFTGILPIANGGTGTATGSITGTGALAFAAGGTNQNVSLSPSGTGSTLLGGSVGIGTTSPAVPLDVQVASNATLAINTNGVLTATSIRTSYFQDPSGNYNYFQFANGSPGSTYLYGRGNTTNPLFVVSPNSSETGDAFQVMKSSGSLALNVTSTGNVGIGTTVPGTILDVRSTMASSSGTDIGVQLLPVVNASGTEGFTSLLVNTTETAIGSGTKRLLDLQVGGVTKMNVSDTGALITAAGASISGTLQVASGSAAAPSYTFGAATGTGLFYAATSQLGFTTATAERMRIDSNGNVGIGTTSPAVSLDLGSKTDALRLPNGTTAQEPASSLAGMIRYNTSIPGVEFYNGSAWSTLSTSGASSFTGVTSISDSTGNITLAPQSATGAVIVNSGTPSTSSSTGAVQVTGGEGVSGAIYAGTTINAGTSVTAATSVITPQLYGSTAASGNILIDGTSNATKGNVLLASAGGNVGIGTASPNALLDVGGYGSPVVVSTPSALFSANTAGIAGVEMRNSSGAAAADFRFLIEANDNSNYFSFAQPSTGNTGSALFGLNRNTGSFIFNNGVSGRTLALGTLTNNSVVLGTSNLERVRVDASGNVGIGTTSPAGKLDVYGAIAISGVNGVSFPTTDSVVGGSIAIGNGALAQEGSLASGAYQNTAVGYQAMNSSSMTSAAVQNVAIGYQAGAAVTSGNQNVFIGDQAASALTTGVLGVGVGYQSIVGSNKDTSIGANATTAGGNTSVAIGQASSATGTLSVALGGNSSASNSGAQAIGAASVASGVDSAAIGFSAITRGQASVAVGRMSGTSTNSSATNNVFVGGNSATTVTSGASNVVLGASVASSTLTTGSNNILIGTSNAVDTPAAATSNFLNIGNLIFATGVGSGTLASPAGNVGIGTTSPTVSLDLGSKTDALRLPNGTTAQEPATSLAGMIRYNTSTPGVEFYNGSAWSTLSASGASSFTGVTNISDSTGNITLAAQTSSGAVIVNSGTASTSSSTGAVQITGGEGVSGAIYAGTTINAGTSVTAATSVITPQLYGSTAASGNILIDGTSNATKGNVLLASAGGNVGVGTASPGNTMQIVASNATSYASSSTSASVPYTSADPVLEIYNSNAASNNGSFLSLHSTNGTNSYNYIGSVSGFGTSNLVFGGRTGSPGYNEFMRITASGFVGIGTTSPAGALNLSGTQPIEYLDAASGTANSPAGITFRRSEGTIASPTAVQSGDWLGSIGVKGYGATGYSTLAPANLTFIATENFTDTANGTQIQFGTTPNGTVTRAVRMTIDNSGNVGIGTTSPGFAVDTVGDVNASGWLRSANNSVLRSSAGDTQINTKTSQSIVFLTNAATERMRVDPSGNVGIGTTNPQALLEIFGSASAVYVPNLTAGVRQRITNLDQTNGNTTDLSFSIANSGGSTVSTARLMAIATNHAAGSESGELALVTRNAGTLAEVMRLSSLGNVGIGTTSPAVSLDLGAKTDALRLPNGTTAQEPATSLVGMIRYNTSTPGVEFYNGSVWSTLSTSGASSFTGVTSISDSTGNITLAPQSSSGAVIVNSGTASTSSSTGAVQITGGEGVSGAIYAGTTINAGTSVTAATSVITPQLYGSTAASGNILIDGTSNATKGNVLLASAGGNVGVGTTSPNSLLTIGTPAGGSGPRQSIQIMDAGYASPSDDGAYSAGDKLITWNGVPGALLKTAIGSESWGMWLQASGDSHAHIAFWTGPSQGVAPVERARFDSAGNFGVGTSSPAALLDVYGTAGQSAMLVPRDSTANRPAGVNGMIRYNTSTASLEGYANGLWTNIGGSNQWTSSGANLIFNPTGGGVGVGTGPTTVNSSANYFPSAIPTFETGGGANQSLAVIRNFNTTSSAVLRQSGLLLKLSNESSMTEDTKMGGMVLESSNAWSSAPNLNFITNDIARVSITSVGNVGIGTTSPTPPLTVSTTNVSGNIATFVSTGSGGAGCSIAWNGTSCSSDARLKENVVTTDTSLELESLLKARPVHFTWIKDEKHDKQTGFIAQEFQKLFPEFVKTDANGYLQVNYAHFVAVLTAGIQEFHAKWSVDSASLHTELTEIRNQKADQADLVRLKAGNVELRGENKTLKAQLEQQKSMIDLQASKLEQQASKLEQQSKDVAEIKRRLGL